MSKISIVIPCYNYAKYLPACIESCMAQTFKDFEIVIVNDASTDNSLRLINELSTRYRKKRILVHSNHKNFGPFYSRNRGIEWAEGDFIVHLDADDMLTPNSLEVRNNEFLRKPKLDIVHGYVLRFKGNAGYSEAIIRTKEMDRHPTIIHAQGLMIRKSVFERFGLYDERFRSKGDKEMLYRLGVHHRAHKYHGFKPKVKIKKIDKNVAFFRRHPGCLTKTRRADEKFNKEVNDLFEKRLKELKKDGISERNTKFL